MAWCSTCGTAYLPRHVHHCGSRLAATGGVGSPTVPEAWYLGAVRERDEARAEVDRLRALAVRLRNALALVRNGYGVPLDNLLLAPDVQALRDPPNHLDGPCGDPDCVFCQ